MAKQQRGVARKKGKKNRKFDRNRIWCQAYKNRGQREKNKLRRLNKHLNRHPGDGCAIEAKGRCKAAL